jgi:hypothetical protein
MSRKVFKLIELSWQINTKSLLEYLYNYKVLCVNFIRPKEEDCTSIQDTLQICDNLERGWMPREKKIEEI